MIFVVDGNDLKKLVFCVVCLLFWKLVKFMFFCVSGIYFVIFFGYVRLNIIFLNEFVIFDW